MAVLETATKREDETRVMALAGVASRVLNAGVVFLTQVLFARVMGVSEFGIYATANTIMLLLAGFATLGLTIMPQRFWPEYAAAGNAAALRGLARFAYWAPFAAGTLFALCGAMLALATQNVISPAVAVVTCLAMIVLPAQASLDVVEGIALARAWKWLAYGVAFVLRPLLVPLVFLAAWMLGVAPDAKLAMLALAVSTWIAALVLLVLVGLKIRQELQPGPVLAEKARWLLAALPVMLIDGAFLLMTSTDVVLLAVFRDDAEVGVYSAAARLVALVAFVHHGLTWASAHHFSALHQAGDMDSLANYARKTTKWMLLPSIVAAGIMALAAPLLLMAFGKGFEGGGGITAILMCGLLLRASVGPAEQLLVMTDNQIASAYAYGWAFVINLGLGLVLVPSYGGLGAAFATAAGYATAVAIIAREVHLRLGFRVDIISALRAQKSVPAHA